MADGQRREIQKDRAKSTHKSEKPSDAALIKALNHPVRRQILRTFEDGKARSAKDITEVIRLPLGSLSYHFGVLKKIGVVMPLRDEQRRGAVKRICTPNLKDADPYVASVLLATEEQDDKEVPRVAISSSLNGDR